MTSPTPSGGETSIHARRAIEGDAESLAWLVERLSPFLLVQAGLRLGPRLRERHPPEDVVADVWAILLPRLGTIMAREGALSRVVVRYASTVLLHRVMDLVRAAAHRRTSPIPDEAEAPALSQAQSGVVSRAVRAERQARVREALEALPLPDREILIYRGLEQRPLAEVATQLGITANAAAVRYHRALHRLREVLPGTLADELSEE